MTTEANDNGHLQNHRASDKHTPGPWHAEEDYKNERDWLVRPVHGEIVGDIFQQVVVTEANARLIAAAPDLLEAAKRMCCSLNDKKCGNSAAMRAAIAKATQPEETEQ